MTRMPTRRPTHVPTHLPARTARRHLTVPVVAALHAVGLAGIAAVVVLQDGGTAVLLTLGLTAYGLGLRHAFDPDHIATIDNTTRRLVRTERDARGVGLWFSLGHSTVVVVAAALLTLGVQALAPMLDDDSSLLRRVTGVWGPLVASTFLLVIGAVNVVLLRRALRSPTTAPDGVGGGPVSWLLRRFEWATDRPARMYGVGLLFGLGFDTATSIGLLAVAGAATLDQSSWYAALPLALLFAAGMSLLDSAQGAVARRVYVTAGARPTGRRRVRYDVLVTGVSAAAALGIAVVTLVQTLAEHVPAAAAVPGASVDLAPYGVALTVVLVVAWGAGALVLRQQRREA
ncbi:HoxN/HupN/NixA family nickel/cobalt transporter [Isoptericola sp. S6320L]|uniref:HoxN/HupN/NixA family nickel/cobalt transporter n=1 Tax=Isoptericola sp. S6320L TaxID=2926411 RepID=UPI001FF665B6|nr:HoxN/HupN/NixA family nickel/cobalt transporter [Isoptericola sp. S6320L]MCK0117930.1 HoxN/HupN/NixA family nickel/cobalt transporter [Isoptericola sp. S6320L]